MKVLQPQNTIVYNVESSDTLSNIALRYDTTPSELSRLNHLSTSLLYPGQTLFVPGKPDDSFEKKSEVKLHVTNTSLSSHQPTETSIPLGKSPLLSPNVLPPTYRTASPSRVPLSRDESLEDLLNRQNSDEEISRRYLKIKAKYITDGQGVVSGVLLVTPQTIMFNPSVSDHLVVDRGREYYVVRLPLKALSVVSLYDDIAAMVMGEVDKQYIPDTIVTYEPTSPPRPGSIVRQETGQKFTINDQIHHDSTLSDNELETAKEQLIKLTVDQSEKTVQLKNDGSKGDAIILQVDADSPQVDAGSPKGDENRAQKHTSSRLDNIQAQENNSQLECNRDVSNNENTIEKVCHHSTSSDQGYGTMSNASNIDSRNDNLTESSPMQPSHQQQHHAKENLDFLSNEHVASTPKHECPTVSSGVIEPNSGIPLNRGPSDNKEQLHLKLNSHGDSVNQSVVVDRDKREKLDSINQTNNIETLEKENTKQSIACSQHSPIVSDSSKDSGFSDINQSQQNTDIDGNAITTVSHKHTIANSERSALSDEAKKWLGSHCVASSSSSDSPSPELEPQPITDFHDHLMYICIKVSKKYWCPTLTKHNAIMGIPPNRDQKRRQHWFAVPRERIDQFYGFVRHWLPELQSQVSSPSSEDFSEVEEGLNIIDDTFGSSSPATSYGWEKLNSEDADSMQKLRVGSVASSRTSLRSFYDDEPEMSSESCILSKEQMKMLSRKLPSRTVGRYMDLVYSTTIHGISLNTLFRNFAKCDCPALLVINDQNGKKFGAYLSDPPQLSDGFYGNGECMLFSFSNENTVQIYKWSGENTFFINGSKTSLSIGGGKDDLSLWLDEDLYRGRSHASQTFNNETLSATEDFICECLEGWGFQ